jgi:hypothetical protein
MTLISANEALTQMAGFLTESSKLIALFKTLLDSEQDSISFTAQDASGNPIELEIPTLSKYIRDYDSHEVDVAAFVVSISTLANELTTLKQSVSTALQELYTSAVNFNYNLTNNATIERSYDASISGELVQLTYPFADEDEWVVNCGVGSDDFEGHAISLKDNTTCDSASISSRHGDCRFTSDKRFLTVHQSTVGAATYTVISRYTFLDGLFTLESTYSFLPSIADYGTTRIVGDNRVVAVCEDSSSACTQRNVDIVTLDGSDLADSVVNTIEDVGATGAAQQIVASAYDDEFFLFDTIGNVYLCLVTAADSMTTDLIFDSSSDMGLSTTLEAGSMAVLPDPTGDYLYLVCMVQVAGDGFCKFAAKTFSRAAGAVYSSLSNWRIVTTTLSSRTFNWLSGKPTYWGKVSADINDVGLISYAYYTVNDLNVVNGPVAGFRVDLNHEVQYIRQHSALMWISYYAVSVIYGDYKIILTGDKFDPYALLYAEDKTYTIQKNTWADPKSYSRYVNLCPGLLAILSMNGTLPEIRFVATGRNGKLHVLLHNSELHGMQLAPVNSVISSTNPYMKEWFYKCDYESNNVAFDVVNMFIRRTFAEVLFAHPYLYDYVQLALRKETL